MYRITKFIIKLNDSSPSQIKDISKKIKQKITNSYLYVFNYINLFCVLACHEQKFKRKRNSLRTYDQFPTNKRKAIPVQQKSKYISNSDGKTIVSNNNLSLQNNNAPSVSL